MLMNAVKWQFVYVKVAKIMTQSRQNGNRLVTTVQLAMICWTI